MAHQTSFVETGFVFRRDAVEPKYSWRDQTWLIRPDAYQKGTLRLLFYCTEIRPGEHDIVTILCRDLISKVVRTVETASDWLIANFGFGNYCERMKNEPDQVFSILSVVHTQLLPFLSPCLSCFSAIGRQGGKQRISVGEGCEYKGTIMHEMMHALGFFHEQSRTDRDNYIMVLWWNIEPGNYHK